MKSISVTFENIDRWKTYFEKEGVLIDVSKVQEFKNNLRKQKRQLKVSNDYTTSEKESIMAKHKYMVNALENLMLYSEEFKRSGALESNGFLLNTSLDNLHVYPSYNYTATHRLMSREPCVSNLSKDVRSVIVAEPDYRLLSIDFRQQEPWIIVNTLGDSELLSILTNHEDFYRGLLSHLSIEVTNENREICKEVWNAGIYGASINTIRGLCSDSWVTDLYTFINKRKSVEEFRQKVTAELKTKRQIGTRFGLTREFEDASPKAARQAFNSLFQMSGAGILYIGLDRIDEAINTSPIKIIRQTKIYLTLHDEFILKIPREAELADIQAFVESIDFRIEDWTTPKVKWQVGDDWGSIS